MEPRTQQAGPLLVLDQVVKQYDVADEGPSPRVLDGVSLEVQTGESIAIIGPSGSGKSTLLNIIAALDLPTGGRVMLDAVDLADLGERQMAALRNRDIGLVFQLHHLLPQCTALENVLVPTLARTQGAKAPEAHDRARHLLQRVGMWDLRSRRPASLSGGERQRVAVARALINQPRLLLADEPTGSLDRASALQIAELLDHINEQEGVTTIVVTHTLELARRMQRVLELRDGRLIGA